MPRSGIRNPDRRRLIRRLIRGIRLLNGGPLDQRLLRRHGLARPRPAAHRRRSSAPITSGRSARLTGELLAAWSDSEGGGIPWRRGDVFKNTPANGPAAILLARTGHLERAAATADWIDGHLRDPATGLIWDGLRPGPDGGTQYETTIYGYCQGVVLGADVELARRVPATSGGVVAAGVAAGHGGRVEPEQGRRAGRPSRAATPGCSAGFWPATWRWSPSDCPVTTPQPPPPGAPHAELIASSADAAWANAAFDDGLPIFGPDWSRPAIRPGRTSPRCRAGPLGAAVRLDAAGGRALPSSAAAD